MVGSTSSGIRERERRPKRSPIAASSCHQSRRSASVRRLTLERGTHARCGRPCQAIWASAAAVVWAAFGSTGLAGLRTGGLQLTKRGRLKKSIARSQEVLSGLPEGTEAHATIVKAIEADATRLAALTLVSFPKSTVWFLRIAYICLVLVTGRGSFCKLSASLSTEPYQLRGQ